MASVISQPNNTLYISNIDWKIKKPLLRRSLFSLMTRHGKVVEIIALRKDGLRGQAFVIFEDVQAATAALQFEQGFTFFGKDLKLAYAKEKSDRISKRDGSYVPRAKRVKREEEPTAATATTTQAATEVDMDVSAEGTSTAVDSTTTTAPPLPPAPTTTATQQQQPTHILFAENLPSECNEMMLAMLFRQYAGFKEVRIPRAGLAFIEFDTEPHATLALERLNGFKLTTTDSLKLTYGKA
jgi:RNA recognition motif-containing protein